MKAVLTHSILHFLIWEGYKYCLSKTSNVQNSNASVNIILKPVKLRLVLRFLPAGYDTYFIITKEPMQLADEIDDTEVYVDIDKLDMSRFHGSISIM